MRKLTDRVAIITGAGSGIGRAAAKLFAKEGASVLVADIDADNAKETVSEIIMDGGIANHMTVDVAIEQDIKDMVARTIGIYGGIDILCNNAGITDYFSVTECPLENWERVMAINVRSVFLGCKYVIPYMLERGGKIINTASVAAIKGIKERAAYSASKGAVLQLTRQVAIDYGRYNIRVNAVCPSLVDTPFIYKRYQVMGGAEEAKKIFASRNCLNRMPAPEEVAKAMIWLASDESCLTTGAAIMVDGGITAM